MPTLQYQQIKQKPADNNNAFSHNLFMIFQKHESCHLPKKSFPVISVVVGASITFLCNNPVMMFELT